MATIPAVTTPAAGTGITVAGFGLPVKQAVDFFKAPPLVACLQSTAQSNANASDVALTYDLELVDTDSMHSVSTNLSRLTAVTAGWYEVFAAASFAPNATGIRALRICKNGSLTPKYGDVLVSAVAGGAPRSLATSVLIYMGVGEYVEAYVYQNSGGALSLNAAGTNVASFQARWISV